jgi:hypothetical protein
MAEDERDPAIFKVNGTFSQVNHACQRCVHAGMHTERVDRKPGKHRLGSPCELFELKRVVIHRRGWPFDADASIVVAHLEADPDTRSTRFPSETAPS